MSLLYQSYRKICFVHQFASRIWNFYVKPINIRSFHTGVLFCRLQAGGSTASMPTMSAPSDISVSTSTDSRHRRPTGSPDSIKLEQVTPPTSPSRQERSLSNPGLHNSMGASDQLYMAPRSNSTSAVSHPVPSFNFPNSYVHVSLLYI